MAKERTPTSYLSDSWGSGSDPESDGNLPYRWKDPATKDWSPQADGASYGHSSDVVEKDDYKCWPDINKDDVARGYTSPKSDGEGGVLETRQPGGSYPASIPSKNEWDRTEPYSNEAGRSNTGNYDGTGEDRPHPGTEQIGSSKLPS
jgi:hypothetical protein